MLETRIGRERRVYERVLARCPVRFKAERENVMYEGSTKDVSDGGLGLFTRSRLKPDMHLQMWVRLSSEIKPLQIEGKVVWSEKRRPDLWRAGISFDQMAFIRIVKMLVSKNLN